MIVPDYWAEAKERIVVDGRAATYKRLGWSDVSEEDALQNAQERLQEVLVLAKSGESVRLIDHKTDYNGQEGLPIREEVVERHGNTVITRNSYGALCLNTPDVVFADVDMPVSDSLKFFAPAYLFLVVVSAWALLPDSIVFFILALIVNYILANLLSSWIVSLWDRLQPDPFELSLNEITAYAEKHPKWKMNVYRTPAGFRVLLLHDTFAADDARVYEFMTAIRSDPAYMSMCKSQQCFRARISPKPWRIGYHRLARSAGGVWPIPDRKLANRKAWVEEYDRLSVEFASCHLVKTLGTGMSHRACEDVKKLHDDYSQSSREDLPMA